MNCYLRLVDFPSYKNSCVGRNSTVRVSVISFSSRRKNSAIGLFDKVSYSLFLNLPKSLIQLLAILPILFYSENFLIMTLSNFEGTISLKQRYLLLVWTFCGCCPTKRQRSTSKIPDVCRTTTSTIRTDPREGT